MRRNIIQIWTFDVDHELLLNYRHSIFQITILRVILIPLQSLTDSATFSLPFLQTRLLEDHLHSRLFNDPLALIVLVNNQ